MNSLYFFSLYPCRTEVYPVQLIGVEIAGPQVLLVLETESMCGGNNSVRDRIRKYT